MWEKHGWTPCPPEALPKTGLVAIHEDRVIAYLGMYVDDGTMAFIEWAVRDPEASAALAGRALKILVETLVRIARERRCQYVYGVTKSRSWGKMLVGCGMARAETGAETYILALDGGDTACFGDED